MTHMTWQHRGASERAFDNRRVPSAARADNNTSNTPATHHKGCAGTRSTTLLRSPIDMTVSRCGVPAQLDPHLGDAAIVQDQVVQQLQPRDARRQRREGGVACVREAQPPQLRAVQQPCGESALHRALLGPAPAAAQSASLVATAESRFLHPHRPRSRGTAAVAACSPAALWGDCAPQSG